MEPQKGSWYEIEPRPAAVGEGWSRANSMESRTCSQVGMYQRS